MVSLDLNVVTEDVNQHLEIVQYPTHLIRQESIVVK